MIPNNFEYFAPTTIEEALTLLDSHGEDGKILSGGQSLVPILKLRLAAPAAVIDIGRIAELKAIAVDGDTIRIGANATHAEIAASAALKAACPLLTETAAQIGDQQVRNRGTIGGSLTHADPAADWPAAMLALDAEIVVRSSQGQRTIKAADFFLDLMTSAVEHDEIVTEIRIVKPEQPNAAVYLKVPQAASGFAVVGVAAQLKISNGQCEDIRIGVTGLAPKAFRAASLESALRGQSLDESAVASASAQTDAEADDAMEDIHASGDYRRHLARVYAKRAVLAAAARA
ncbi:MAG TPA: xanthine dehydrogenase family protein subunit M [Blastocatellia bacterium]|nr:xanthine dehydrogenase family protein subunit M [Blastocatellia bacterium]HNG28299.1 xanthine dehydrogenase family protein subunit M [Blastocatellia bacterium]